MRWIAAVAMALAISGCTSTDTPDEPEPTTAAPSASPSPVGGEQVTVEGPDGVDPDSLSAEVTLDDGRRVFVFLKQGSGAFAQVYSPDDKSWSDAHEIAASTDDVCQDVQLEAVGETVAASFGFGTGCFQGKPAQEVIAAVGTGSFDSWAVQTQPDVERFAAVRVVDDGATAEFDGDGGTLTWRQQGGFGS